MDRLQLPPSSASSDRGFPISLDDIRLITGGRDNTTNQSQTPSKGIYDALDALASGLNNGIISGCKVNAFNTNNQLTTIKNDNLYTTIKSQTTPITQTLKISISEGFVCIDNKIYYFPSRDIIVPTTQSTYYLIKPTTSSTSGNRNYRTDNNQTGSVYYSRNVTLALTPTSLPNIPFLDISVTGTGVNTITTLLIRNHQLTITKSKIIGSNPVTNITLNDNISLNSRSNISLNDMIITNSTKNYFSFDAVGNSMCSENGVISGCEIYRTYLENYVTSTERINETNVSSIINNTYQTVLSINISPGWVSIDGSIEYFEGSIITDFGSKNWYFTAIGSSSSSSSNTLNPYYTNRVTLTNDPGQHSENPLYIEITIDNTYPDRKYLISKNHRYIIKKTRINCFSPDTSITLNDNITLKTGNIYLDGRVLVLFKETINGIETSQRYLLGKTTGLLSATFSIPSSDSKLKTNISELPYNISTILKLSPVIHNWNETYIEKYIKSTGIVLLDNATVEEKESYNSQIEKYRKECEKQEIGLIAQDVHGIIPEVVGKDSDGYYTINYPKLVPVLINGIKEQQDMILKQQKIIEKQQAQLDLILKRLDKLEK